MVQVVEQAPGLGELLGGGLGQGLSSGLQMLAQAKLKSMQDLQDLKALSGLGEREQVVEGIEAPPRRYSTEELLFAEKRQPGSAKILMEQQKRREEEFAKQQETARISGSASQMLENIEFTGPVKLLAYGDKETRERRQEFDTLALELEKEAADMVGKGTLSQQRFKFLKERLPSSSKTQAANMGSLKAWNRILNLNLPQFEEIKEPAAEKIKKAEEGETLSLDLAKKFLEMAKGDKEKARKIARQYGYKF